MTAALAAQGGAATSAALYGATIAFDAVLSGLIRILLMPMVYIYLLLGLMHATVGEALLKRLREVLKSLMTWSLKTILYIYTGFIGITGAVSGTTDAVALKAAKLTISSVVPVIGGILSDASEAVLVGAGTVKNAAGIYGFFAIIAIWISPFLQIGVHYLLLKATGAVCTVFAGKEHTGLIQDFSSAMGLLLAMTGTICLMLLISLVCYLKGVG
jgi:stage III sporulation protein AE